jgi:hypothetical protein
MRMRLDAIARFFLISRSQSTVVEWNTHQRRNAYYSLFRLFIIA